MGEDEIGRAASFQRRQRFAREALGGGDREGRAVFRANADQRARAQGVHGALHGAQFVVSDGVFTHRGRT